MPWLGLLEAAEHLGVSATTIRRRIQSGELPARQEQRPQGYVWLVQVDEDAQVDAPPPAHGDTATHELVQVLREQIAHMDQEIAHLQQQAARKDQQIAELHVLLGQAQRALPPGPTPVEHEEPQAPRTASWGTRLWRRVTGK